MSFDKDQKPAQCYLLFLLGIALVLTLYTIAGFWVLPHVVKSLLEEHLSRTLDRRVSIEKVRINPYELAFSIQGFTVRDQNATAVFLAFDELYAVVQGGSLVERAPILREVRLSGPYVNISRKADGRFNFTDLLEAPGAAPEALPQKVPESASKPDSNTSQESSAASPGKTQDFRFSIHNLQISNGTVDYFDEAKGEHQRIANLGLELPLVSCLGETPEGGVHLTLKAKLNESPLSVVARGKPFVANPEWSVEVELRALNILDYLAYLPSQLGVKVGSGWVDANATLTYAQTDGGPVLNIAGDASLSGFDAVDRHEANLIRLPLVKIGLESFEPLAGKLHLSRILIQSPDLTLSRHKDGTLNVQKLVTAGTSQAQEDNGSEPEPGFQVAIDAVEIAGGRVGVTDQAVEPTFHASLEKVDLSLREFTNTPGSRAAIKLEARTGDNETIGIEGSLSPDPLAWEGRVNLSGLMLARYAPYYQKQILFEVLDGRLGLASTLRVAASGKEGGLSVTDLVSSLTSLKLKKPDEPESFLEIPELQIQGVTLNPAEKAVTIAELSSQTAKLNAIRDDKGGFNLQQLIAAPPQEVSQTADEPASSEPVPSLWKVLLQKLAVQDFAIRFEDRTRSEPTTFLVDQIKVEGRDLSVDEESKPHFTLSCRVNEGGTVQAEGDLKTAPLFADLKLTLKDLDLPPVQPYLPPDIKVKVTAGKVSSSGRLMLGIPKDGDFNASYVGDLSLSDFSSVDTLAGEDFLKWKNLEVKGLDAGTHPLRAGIKRLDWRSFFTRIAISPEGKINVLQMLGGETEVKGSGSAGATAKTPATADSAATKGRGTPGREAEIPRRQPPTSAPAAITIDQIALQGGTIAFSDNLIKPNVHAQMLDVSGTISGLSSQKDMRADVNLRGKLYNSSPLEITGKLRPFPDNLFADLSVTFKNIDMTRWDPYARKYVGYTLEKGNLQLELKYLLAKRKLDSQNHIVLDRLTLGEKVESPEATTLPVKFALSLLQDRNGRIALGIPVSGDLDDPQFSLGSTILAFLKNLAMKAITAPFTLLGALLPEGVGDVDRLEMSDAGGTIPDASVKKLETLAKVLEDRPNLEVDIQGTIHREKGMELLRQELFLKKLKAQKLKELMKRGGASVALDQVTIAPDESDKYLKLAYDEEFPKEGLDRIRFFKKTPAEEMKTRLLSTIQVTDEDLRALAYEWGLKVKEYLAAAGKIEPRRLFLLEPALTGAADQAKAKGNGVDLKLK